MVGCIYDKYRCLRPWIVVYTQEIMTGRRSTLALMVLLFFSHAKQALAEGIINFIIPVVTILHCCLHS